MCERKNAFREIDWWKGNKKCEENFKIFKI